METSCTVVLLCNLELCKGTKSYFCSANSFKICVYFSFKVDISKIDRNAPITILELGVLDFLVSKRSASVKYATLLEQNLGFSACILKVLQCLHKSSWKRIPNEIMDYFVCKANAHAWKSCILCQYAPVRAIWKNTRLLMVMNHKQECFGKEHTRNR